jgi:hypothetical protein
MPREAGFWIWLFPATMVVHVAEEALTAGTFPVWISRVAGVGLTLGEFLVFNAIAFAAVVAGAFLSRSRPWAVAALGTAMATNVVFHLGGTLLTGTWSPGLASGVLLWIPLAAVALVHTARHARRRDLAIGLVVGFLAHGAVSLSLVLA